MFEEMSIEGVEEMPIEEVEQRPIERVEELPQLLFANEDVTVKQLIVGYADKGSACGSVTLISIKDYNVLVDCGLPSTDLSYISSSTSINCVIITHWHSDHCGRLSDFLDVREVNTISQRYKEIRHFKEEEGGFQKIASFFLTKCTESNANLSLNPPPLNRRDFCLILC